VKSVDYSIIFILKSMLCSYIRNHWSLLILTRTHSLVTLLSFL